MGEIAPAEAAPQWLQARLDELVDQAVAARAAAANGGAWRESLATLAAIEDLADDLQHAVVNELRTNAPKAWSWSTIGRALGVTPQAAHTRFAERARARRRKRPATPQEPVTVAASTPPPAPVPAATETERHQDMLMTAASAAAAAESEPVPAAGELSAEVMEARNAARRRSPFPATTPAPPPPPAPARRRRRGAAKEAAYKLVKADDHQESHRWYVLADGERIGWVQPEYGVTGGRKGWRGVMANAIAAVMSGQAAVRPTRDAAAVQVIESWQRMRSHSGGGAA